MAYKENLQQTMGGYQQQQQQWQQPQQQPYGQPYPQPMNQPLPPYQVEQIYQMAQRPQKNDDYHRFVNYLNFQKQVDFVNNLVAGGIVRLPGETTMSENKKDEESTFGKIFAIAVGVSTAIVGMGILGNL